MPITIKQFDSINTFKSHLKAFPLSHAYNQLCLTVQEDYAFVNFGVLLIVFFFLFLFRKLVNFGSSKE